jgi:hypothetical protein
MQLSNVANRSKTRHNKGLLAAALIIALGFITASGAEPTVSPQLYAGLTITGDVGSNYMVEASNDLSQSNTWQAVAYLALPSSPYLWMDTNAPARNYMFYRVQNTPRLIQADGNVMPAAMTCSSQRPFGLQAYFASICNPSAQYEANLWHILGDDPCIPSQHNGLDAWADASVQSTFIPTNSITMRVVTRGQTYFNNAFAWYNVTGSKPSVSDLHVFLDCSSSPGTAVVLNIQSEPDYHGGAIGFALITPESTTLPGNCAGGNCCATLNRLMAGQGRCYYSEKQYNPDLADSTPFVHFLAYKSKVFPNRYYLACEDTFGAPKNTFTDMVVAVDGIFAAP